ncbi:MAG: glycerophosphodiester phosphodiesterase [Alphaproteobacteria bacterium]|nr:glycerophosphodiester phosphodiesterase [Alphaproteobacteria bacterium]
MAADDETPAQLGPRPFALVDHLNDGALKQALKQCGRGPFYKSEFSIGHRGAPLQFPEHTEESYRAAARMGAGIIECDVTFTKDRALVCRHSQCDLHTTTNILAKPDIASECSVPFTPADPANEREATAKCCTSDITLSQFRQLSGKMDAANRNATSVEDYMRGTGSWRTDLYATRGTLLTHAESIALFKELGVKMTPELKSPSVDMPFDGVFSQQAYARKLIDEYEAAGVEPSDVFPQSFNRNDVLFWLSENPQFGQQAVYLDGRYPDLDPEDPASWTPSMEEIAQSGIRYLAPPLWFLVRSGSDGRPEPSAYATAAKAAGLNLITWTLERSGPLTNGGGWYYQTIADITDNDGDALVLLDVLAKEVGVVGVFSDWPATTTYYANCMGLN